ncbi:hypothetical protein ACIRU8_12405 [Streptomyces sp. NPDC101175]|uniref:hypothetical protein n=1 Tax=Streptomyces sp. NPDC101175 TaxID=3366123 RepID=UPI0038393406
MTINAEVPVAATRAGSAAARPGQDAVAVAVAGQDADDSASAADLVLPLVAVGGVGILAGYGYVRRTRRARTRTTPGAASPVLPPSVSPRPPTTPLPVLERQAGAALVQADDCVRAGRSELAFAEARFGATAVEPFALALREAERELSAAFAIRLRYGQGFPEEEAARRHALAGVVGRCAEAGRRLDAVAPGFDQLRALERDMNGALEIAEGRFRELTGRTGAVESALATLHTRYPAPATTPVTGYVEQAKDRLVFATTHLNQARQAADLGRTGQAVRELRAAEGAIGQADTLLGAVDRLADSLTGAADLVPAALTGAEAERAGRSGRSGPTGATGPTDPTGDLDAVLAAVREELTGDRPYDPLAALRSVVRAVAALGAGPDGVLGTAAWLVGRSDVRAADDFVATHRGAVGAGARTLLAEAQRLLGTDPGAAGELALRARESAEQDVRVHGNPYSGPAEHTAGAVLGGVLLGEDPDGGPPPAFGGPDTRKRGGPGEPGGPDPSEPGSGSGSDSGSVRTD